MPLKQTEPRLKTLGGRLGFGDPADNVRQQDRQRYAATPWRKLYSTKRWQLLRLQILDRDHWTCRQTGVLLRGKKGDPAAPVVDHIEPASSFWSYDRSKFWDPANLQSVTAHWHDTVKRKEERDVNR